MKINGKKYESPHEVIIAIPRGSAPGDAAVFRAKAVVDYSQFDRLCPEVTVISGMRPGGEWTAIPDDPRYMAAVQQRDELRHHFMQVKSLEATPGLEWDTVKMDDPTTWANWKTDLKKAGFSRIEIVRISNGVQQANCLDDDLVKAARESFLAGVAAGHLSPVSDSRNTAPIAMPSGAVVSA